MTNDPQATPLPCIDPQCGGETRVGPDDPLHAVYCGQCGFISPGGDKPISAVRAHNRIYNLTHPTPPSEPLSARHRRIRELLDARGIPQGSDCTMLERMETALARRRLPPDRESVTQKVEIGGYTAYIRVGLHANGAPGEVFMTVAKQGGTLSGLLNAWAVAFSTALQYGTPLSVLVSRYEGMTFAPMGPTTDPAIPTAQSIPDYVARWMAGRWPEFARSSTAVEVLDRAVGEEQEEVEG